MSRRRLAGLAVVIVLVVLFGGRWLAVRYTEHLWYAQLGQADRHLRLLARSVGWQAGLLATLFLWFGAHMFAVYRSIGSVQLPRRLGNLEIAEAVPRRILRSIALGFALLLAIATTWAFADFGQYVSLYRHTVPLGLKEQILQRDAAFYLARLPLLEVTHMLASIAVLLAAFVVVALYGLTGSFTVARRRVRITPHARTHLVMLLGALALIIAWGFQLDALQLVAGGGTHNGVLSVVDRSVRLPASHALAVIALVVAAGSIISLRWSRPVLLFALWATLAAAALLGRFLVPAMSDAWDRGGKPQLAAMLQRYGDGHTRAAFGLLDLPVQSVAAAEWRPDSAPSATQALDGLSPWAGEKALLDAMLSRAVGDSFSSRALTWSTAPVALPQGRPAVLAVGQADLVSLSRLQPQPRWEELHRESFAWGGDPVAFDGRIGRGVPAFFASLQPPDTARPGTALRRVGGRVRFLALPAGVGIVGPGEGTVDQPPPGIPLRGFARRVLLAWALQSPPLMNSHTSPADRVLYWRDVPSRLARLYPFASFDTARPAMVGGRLFWVADGFVLSSRFPLAQRLRWNAEDINYLSSPYVATVDAETGTTRLYLRPPDLPFAAGLARAEGVEPLTSDSLPGEIARQAVYPPALLGAQAAMLGKILSEGSERPWVPAFPDSSVRDAALLPPAVAVLDRDGGGPRVWSFDALVDPQTARLAGVLGGTVADSGALRAEFLRADGPSWPAPAAAGTRMASAPVVVAAAVAAGGPGSIRHGPVQVVPAGGTLMYARAVFSQPASPRDGASTPLGLIVLAGGRVGFGANAAGAVRALASPDGGADVLLAGSGGITEARAAFLALDSARLAGDWERFGRAWLALRRALQLDPPAPGARP